jgi:hypothetical protein
MDKIITGVKSNYRSISLFYLICTLLALGFFWPESRYWQNLNFPPVNLTDRWLYIRIFQLLTLVLIGFTIFELDKENKEKRLRSMPLIILIHLCALIFTFVLDTSILNNRREAGVISNWYPFFYLVFGLILARLIIQIIISVDKTKMYPDIIFLIVAWFFSNSKNQLSELLFNLTFTFLLITLMFLSWVRFEMYIENDSQIEEKSKAFYRIFAVGFWLFLFSIFSSLSYLEKENFSFISFYLLFCIIGLLYFLSTKAIFYLILFSVVFLTGILFSTFKILELIESNEVIEKYLLQLPLIISVFLLLIGVSGVNFLKIKK